MTSDAVERATVPKGRGEREARSELRTLWAAIVVPPIGFLSTLGIAYAVIPASCARDSAVPLYLSAMLGLVLTVAPTALAWRAWRRVGRDWPGEHAGGVDRSRFMGALGAVGGAFFALMVVAFWIALVMIPHCRR